MRVERGGGGWLANDEHSTSYQCTRIHTNYAILALAAQSTGSNENLNYQLGEELHKHKRLEKYESCQVSELQTGLATIEKNDDYNET